jgi:hypothetical protein
LAAELKSEIEAVSETEGARAQRRELVDRFGWYGGWEVRPRRDILGA